MITIEIRKPNAVQKPQTTLSINPYQLEIFLIATPSTAQFVVINGKYTPSASYNAGINFLSAISTNCTNAAMIKINAIVCKYSKPSGSKIHF